MKVNQSLGGPLTLSCSVGFSPILGGWVSGNFSLSPGVNANGPLDVQSIWIDVQWKNKATGADEPFSTSDYPAVASDGSNIVFTSSSNGGMPTDHVAHLYFHVYINTNAGQYAFTIDTGFDNYCVPDTPICNDPSNMPLSAGQTAVFGCSWDFNGPSTNWDAQIINPNNGQVMWESGAGGNQWAVSGIDYYAFNGVVHWRAMCHNICGYSGWGNGSFAVTPAIQGSVNCVVTKHIN